MAWKGHSKNSGTQNVPRITLKCSLGVSFDLIASDLPLAYSFGPFIVKDVTHDWVLHCCLPPGLREEGLEQLNNSHSLYLQAACIDQPHQAAIISYDNDELHMQELACFRATASELEAMRAHCEDVPALGMKTGKELCNGY